MDLGSVVTRRAFPSLVTMTSVPVSATAMLAPLMPMPAFRNRSIRKLPPGDLHQARDVGAEPLVDFLAEDLGHLFLGQVDGRHHHVRRALSHKLDDPLAQVGLET